MSGTAPSSHASVGRSRSRPDEHSGQSGGPDCDGRGRALAVGARRRPAPGRLLRRRRHAGRSRHQPSSRLPGEAGAVQSCLPPLGAELRRQRCRLPCRRQAEPTALEPVDLPGLPRQACRRDASDRTALFEDVYKPPTFPSAQQCVRSLKEQGLRIVLVTGAIDFTIEPMAAYLEADALLAASLEEVNGVFTMDGGHKSLTVGLGTYETVRHNHNPAMLEHSALMDPANSALACSFARQGRIVQDACKVFRIETELNSNAFPPTCRSCRNRSVPMGRSTGRRPGCRPWPALICRCR
jgi:hypothetical protein